MVKFLGGQLVPQYPKNMNKKEINLFLYIIQIYIKEVIVVTIILMNVIVKHVLEHPPENVIQDK